MEVAPLKATALGFLGLLSSPSSGGDSPPATIAGYTYRGTGFCENAQGEWFDYNTINGVETVERCAEKCTEAYSSDATFVGINFHPDWFGSPNCNCMVTSAWASPGVIAGANGFNEELCYSWDEVNCD